MHVLYMRKFCIRHTSKFGVLEQNCHSASIERVLVYIRSVQIGYKKRNRKGGHDEFLLDYNTGCKKHTADRALGIEIFTNAFAGNFYE